MSLCNMNEIAVLGVTFFAVQKFPLSFQRYGLIRMISTQRSCVHISSTYTICASPPVQYMFYALPLS